MFSYVKVISVNKDSTVTVGCSSKACEGCKAEMFCNNKDDNTFLALNLSEIELSEGDNVEIFLPPAKTIMSTLLVFALPLCLFPVGYLLVKSFLHLNELLNALGGIAAMAVAFATASIVSIKLKKKLMPSVTRKITADEISCKESE